MTSYATLAATYAASYTLAHVFLKASDLGLETADSLLKWTSSEKVRIAKGFFFVLIFLCEGGTSYDGSSQSAQRSVDCEEGGRCSEWNRKGKDSFLVLQCSL